MGGNVYRTMLYIFNNGLELEADYPYISDVNILSSFKSIKPFLA